MDVAPDFASFERAYAAGTPQVVRTSLVADLETPVSAFIKLAEAEPYAFLFESVEGGSRIGRYSFIALRPDLIWRCFGDRAEINRHALADRRAFEAVEAEPLASLRALIAESHIDLPPGAPPMAASLIGYMGYDSVRRVEPISDTNPDILGVPDGIFVRPTVTAVFDRLEDRITVFTPVYPSAEVSAQAAWETACARLTGTLTDFERSLPYRHERHEHTGAPPSPQSNMTPDAFREMVRRAKAYIAAGDIYQVVLSQRFDTPFELPPFQLYRALRRLNPSPFLFHARLDDFALVGSSPEVLVRVREGEVTVRPIAGTRKRGATRAADRALAEDLLNDPKELAEHLMLLDLGRNDVGRVAATGSVRVTERMVIETYSHVLHIVSNVTGRLAGGCDAMDALMAGFPAGTTSGAPKVRAMEIIDELESSRRGTYAGAVGYFGAGGDMDTCIALRTALVKDGTMSVQAGGGVVADSDPESEYQESCNKARALIRAAEEAVRIAGGG